MKPIPKTILQWLGWGLGSVAYGYALGVASLTILGGFSPNVFLAGLAASYFLSLALVFFLARRRSLVIRLARTILVALGAAAGLMCLAAMLARGGL